MYVDDASCLYILIEDFDKELNDFIITGKSEYKEFHVLPKTKEEELINECEHLGFEYRYFNHRLEYMNEIVIIKYLKIHNPESGISISLIPWFVVPRKPFPIVVYIYADWYYHVKGTEVPGKKSLQEAAIATGKLFGIMTLNKSTVSRNIGAMKKIIDMPQKGLSLTVSDFEVEQSDTARIHGLNEDAVEQAIGLLKSCPSIKVLKEKYHGVIEPLPKAINANPSAKHVLSDVPAEYSQILINTDSVNRNNPDKRNRPPRPRKKREKDNPVQHRLRFVEYARREKIRKEFIEICRQLVLDAAVKYHCFLI